MISVVGARAAALLVTLVLITACNTSEPSGAGIVVADAVATTGSPTAIYLSLRNDGKAQTIVAAELVPPAQGRLTLHQTANRDDIATMVAVTAIEVPSGQSQLRPGGYHLMGELSRSMDVGEQVALRLVFDDGTKIEVTADVVDPADILGRIADGVGP